MPAYACLGICRWPVEYSTTVGKIALISNTTYIEVYNVGHDSWYVRDCIDKNVRAPYFVRTSQPLPFPLRRCAHHATRMSMPTRRSNAAGGETSYYTCSQCIECQVLDHSLPISAPPSHWPRAGCCSVGDQKTGLLQDCRCTRRLARCDPPGPSLHPVVRTCAPSRRWDTLARARAPGYLPMGV